jgi:RHS repeat-associated protein
MRAFALPGRTETAGSTPTIVSKTQYYPFGAIESQTAPAPTDRLYTGQRQPVNNEVYDYGGARLYNAYTGRFMQADSIVPGAGNPQALNRYSYVVNNPMRCTDPTGHSPADMEECWHNGQLTCGGGGIPEGGSTDTLAPGGSFGETGASWAGDSLHSVVGEPDPLSYCECHEQHVSWLYQSYWAALILHRDGDIDDLDWSWEQRLLLLNFEGLGMTYGPPPVGSYQEQVAFEAAMELGVFGGGGGGSGGLPWRVKSIKAAPPQGVAPARAIEVRLDIFTV